MINWLSEKVYQNKTLLFLILLINIVGIGYGFYYYIGDFQVFPSYMWILVSDSPNAVIFFAIFVALLLLERRNGYIETLAFMGLFKVGIWTGFIIILYGEYFLQPTFFLWYSSLFLLHIGMALQALVMIPLMKIKPKHVSVAAAFYVINDVVDYYLGFVPRRDIIIPGTDRFYIVALESILMTLIVAYYLYRKSKFTTKD